LNLEGNAIATSPTGRIDAGIVGLRRTGRRRLIVDAFHDLDDSDRLVADRHTETLQLRAGQIGIGTGIIKDKLDRHVTDIAFWTAIVFMVLAVFCWRLRAMDRGAYENCFSSAA
jgi:hypothetical protein